MDYRQFYQQIGNLLYAVSGIDGSINRKEISTIRESVSNVLVPLEREEDEFGTDMAWLAEFQFDYCLDNGTDPKEAYNAFIGFFQDHKSSFNNDFKKLLFRITSGVAESFHHLNKKELDLLEDLKKELNLEGQSELHS